MERRLTPLTPLTPNLYYLLSMGNEWGLGGNPVNPVNNFDVVENQCKKDMIQEDFL